MDNSSTVSTQNFPKLFKPSPAVSKKQDTECSQKTFVSMGDYYIKAGKLGKGLPVAHKTTNIPYTILDLKKNKIVQSNLVDRIQSTINLMYSLKSPFIAHLLNHFETKETLFLIFENMSGTTLEDLILKKQKLSKDFALNIFTQVCAGVKELNKLKNFNISVTPEDIIIDNDNIIKLTDFGLKLSYHEKKKSNRINIIKNIGRKDRMINSYTSPEQITCFSEHGNIKVTDKLDSWNLGILLYEMLTGFGSPFKEKNFVDNISKGILNLDKIEDSFCKETIRQLLNVKPENRLSLDELLSKDVLKNMVISYKEFDENDRIINLRKTLESNFGSLESTPEKPNVPEEVVTTSITNVEIKDPDSSSNNQTATPSIQFKAKGRNSTLSSNTPKEYEENLENISEFTMLQNEIYEGKEAKENIDNNGNNDNDNNNK